MHRPLLKAKLVVVAVLFCGIYVGNQRGAAEIEGHVFILFVHREQRMHVSKTNMILVFWTKDRKA